MILARDLTIEAGIRTLVSGASLNLQPGDKVGLVGRNGAGKTTLMRTLAGELNPADGHLARSGVIGYLSQESALPEVNNPDLSALERILTARDIGDLEVQIEEVRRKMAVEDGEARDRLIRRYDRLQLEFETRGGYAAIAEAKKFAASVGIETADLDQPVATMSGGQRRRVELARVLFQETDTLLLDEPTNHIDLDAKAWLMDWLSSYQGGLLVVSHDLQLLDESITSVLAVDDGTLEPYRGNYSYYLTERDRRREQRIRERKHQDEKIARLEEGIRRFKGSTEKMARRAHTWETRVNRLRSELTEVSKLGKNITVKFPHDRTVRPHPAGRQGSRQGLRRQRGLSRCRCLCRARATAPHHGSEWGGQDDAAPHPGRSRSGRPRGGGHRSQSLPRVLRPGARADRRGQTVFEHVKAVSTEPDQTLRSVLGHFLLADKVDQDAGTLSGGEKTKLALCQVVLGGPNVMLLDEPTNNLDPQAQSALLDALHHYPGTIILVSHDTDFVSRLEIDRAILMPEGTTAYFDQTMLDLVALA